MKILGDELFINNSLFYGYYQEGENAIGDEIKVWYDQEGDYLEVMFERKKGYFRETQVDAVMKKVDQAGNVIGFSILKVSALT